MNDFYENDRVAYLASPYSHPNSDVKEKRLHIVNKVVCELVRSGKMVYSPLTHNTTIDRFGISGGWELWGPFDRVMLSRCNYLLVLKQDGWETSKGVLAEIQYARELGMEIEYMDVPETILAESVEHEIA